MTIGAVRQRGQSLVEALIVLPIFGVFLLGVFQAVLFYRAKALVDYATQEAARSGATAFAEIGAMRSGLARGLAPLYTHSADREAAVKAVAAARLDIGAGAARIEIISPTREAFDDWKVRQFDGVEAIPNDSLAFRPTTPGRNSGLSVQDANLLKIRVTYDFPLIVPVIDLLLGESRLRPKGSIRVLPISASATLPMQTPILDPSRLP